MTEAAKRVTGSIGRAFYIRNLSPGLSVTRSMEGWAKDLKFGIKLLLRDKGFTVTAVLTLAVALGANLAVFSIVRSVLQKPLPFPDSHRVMAIHNSYPNAGVIRTDSAVPDYFDRKREVPSFEELAIYRFQGLTVGEPGATRRVRAMRATPSLLQLLRAAPARGRVFLEEEGEIGNEAKAILTYALWQELYGGTDDVVAREIRVNGTPHEIVGVLPERFLFLSPEVRLLIPAVFTEEDKSDDSRHSNNWEMIGRLAPGATLEQAQSQIDALNAVNLERFPAMREIVINAGFHTTAVPLQEDVVRDLRGTLQLLWGGVAAVLLIAVVNVANLVLVRSQTRLKELAIRSSIGAGRLRIARQLVTEMFLLTLAGASVGIAIGLALIRGLHSFGIDELPRGTEIRLDLVSLAIAVAAAFVVGALLALIPVARMFRMNLSDIVHQEGRTSTGGRGAALLRKTLVVAQVAFALVLLIGAGLLFASFRRVLAIDPGFRPESVVTAAVSLPPTRYAEEADMLAFHERALAGIRSIAGVESAGATSVIPFGGSYNDSVIMAEGYPMAPGESLISPSKTEVTPGYFETMGIPLLRGRLFAESDDGTAGNVVLVDERLAKKFWPDSDAVGKRMYEAASPEDLVRPSENVTWHRVIGVVGSIRQRGLVGTDDRIGAYYFPYRQRPWRYLTFVLRSERTPESVVAEAREIIRAIDPELPLYDVLTMAERVDQSLVARKTSILLSAGFGVVALLLAAVGIYGVLAYLVSQRTREIGIRMALGGTTRSAVELVLREGAVIVGLGLALGFGGALLLRGVLEQHLYGVGATDPSVLAAVSGLLAAVALVASVVPALRAASIHPVQAIRGD
jgi:predicted permease